MKIGLMVGRERMFPDALIARINEKHVDGITAEMVKIGGTALNQPIPYRVIIDRISHEVPYFRAYVTGAVAEGVTVINNPFWWSADNKFIECVLAEKLGVAVPRTVLLPNCKYEADIIDESLRNLVPIPWADIVEYVGLPAVIKPAIGGGSKSVSVVRTEAELRDAYSRSGVLTMIVQECVEYRAYVRCWVIGRKDVRISGYDFSKPHANRYHDDHRLSPALLETVERHCLTLACALGYDIDTIEFAVRDEVPIAIDFLNPAPDCESNSVGVENFEWVVEHTAALAIRYAQADIEIPRPNWNALVAAVPPIFKP